MKKKIISLLLIAVMATSLVTTMVSADTFALDRSKILTASDLPIYETVDFEGKKDAMEFNTEGKQAAIRYGSLNMSTEYSNANRYLLVDCYYAKESSVTTPYGINVNFRQTTSGKWINKEDTSTRSSGLSALPNRWVTIAIDCQDPLQYLVTNGYSLSQLQINIPATTGNERFYIGDVKFAESTGSFALNRRGIMTATDLPEYTTVDFGNKKDVMCFENVSSYGTKAIRYSGIHMGFAYAASNRYLLVDCCLEDEEQTDFDLGVTFRSVNNGDKWINKEDTSTRTSGKYPANSWVTVAIDCQDPLTNIASNSYSLTQLQINIPETTGKFYVGDVRFLSTEREMHYLFEDENGKFVFLSEDGTATFNGETVDAFINVPDAFSALGASGGTVYLEGELNSFTDVANGKRGPILFRGLGDTAEDISANVLNQIRDIEIKGGDITFDYLTVIPYVKAEGTEDNPINYTSFFTCQSSAAPIKQITMGEHLESTGLSVNVRKGNETLYANHDVFTINGGTYYAVTPLTNYGLTTLNRLGSVEWTINGGTIHSLYAGSNNSWEWEQSQLRGDVRYTINGGDFDDKLVMGSAYGSTEIQGNIVWTINGGNMFNKTIVGGDEHITKGNREQKYLNNVAAIVNLKSAKSGLRSLTLGTEDAKGLDITGKEIYILNNYEDNLGTQIADGSLAEYKMHIYNGKAEPVFANDQSISVNGNTEYYGGSLLGFTLTPDKEGVTPYMNGEELQPNISGIYEIAPDTENVIEIMFEGEELPVESVALNKSEITLKKNDTESLEATVYPEDAENKSVEWSTSDETVATVDENGLVTAIGEGTATITATTVDGSFTATCTVTVEGSVMLGDVTGDGKITSKDDAFLARYIAKWTGYDETNVIVAAADTNADGRITIKDNAILSRYIAKWKGYETLPYKQ